MAEWNRIFKVAKPARARCNGCQRHTLLPWMRTERVRDDSRMPPYAYERYCVKCAEPIRVMDGLDKTVNG